MLQLNSINGAFSEQLTDPHRKTETTDATSGIPHANKLLNETSVSKSHTFIEIGILQMKLRAARLYSVHTGTSIKILLHSYFR